MLCVGVLHAYMYTLCVHACALPIEPRRGHHISWNWSCRQLWAATRMLGTKLSFSGRRTVALNSLSQLLRPLFTLKDKYLKSIGSTSCCLYDHGCGTIYWSMSLLIFKAIPGNKESVLFFLIYLCFTLFRCVCAWEYVCASMSPGAHAQGG